MAIGSHDGDEYVFAAQLQDVAAWRRWLSDSDAQLCNRRTVFVSGLPLSHIGARSRFQARRIGGRVALTDHRARQCAACFEFDGSSAFRRSLVWSGHRSGDEGTAVAMVQTKAANWRAMATVMMLVNCPAAYIRR